MKRILINATQQEEIRVAMVDGQFMYDLDIEQTNKTQKKANIYKGIITRVEPSLNAAFINYGAERHGFLPFKEISREYWRKDAKTEGRPLIKDVIKEGQEVLIQIEKEERGNKGASLTTFISLAGRFLVLMPNNPRAGGVSRRIEGEDRHRIKKQLSELDIEEGGAIVRTAGLGREVEELSWDLEYLKMLWSAIGFAYKQHQAPTLLYQESNLIIRTLRDYFRHDIGEIMLDNEAIYNQAREFVKAVMPNNLNKLKLYTDKSVPLFSRYQVEHQIESAFDREVTLPSGGAIVIDHTEALISIDINSARATKGSDIEETAYNTNLEAAAEIARQLRLRDIGGLIVIDFIDMMPNRNQRGVEKKLRELLKLDRARVQIGRISRFGLLEMSRQRLRPSLGEASQIVCPRCSGQGTFRGVESLALSILRLIEEEAMKDKTHQVSVQVPVEVASFLLNEKRPAISKLETRHSIQVVILPNPHLTTPHFEINRFRSQDKEALSKTSYQQIDKIEQDIEVEQSQQAKNPNISQAEVPAIKQVIPQQPAPLQPTEPVKKTSEKATGGFFSRVFGSLFGGDSKAEEVPTSTKDAPKKKAPIQKQPSAQKQPSNQRKTQQSHKTTSTGHQRRRPAQSQTNNRNKQNPQNNNNQNQDQQKRNNNPQANKNTANKRPQQNKAQQKKTQHQKNTPKPQIEDTKQVKEAAKDHQTSAQTDNNNSQNTQENKQQKNSRTRGNRRGQNNRRNNRNQNRRPNPEKQKLVETHEQQLDQTPVEITIPTPKIASSSQKPAKPKKQPAQTTTSDVSTDKATATATNTPVETTTSEKPSQKQQPRRKKPQAKTPAKEPTRKNVVKEKSDTGNAENKQPINNPTPKKKKPQTKTPVTSVKKEAKPDTNETQPKHEPIEKTPIKPIPQKTKVASKTDTPVENVKPPVSKKSATPANESVDQKTETSTKKAPKVSPPKPDVTKEGAKVTDKKGIIEEKVQAIPKKPKPDTKTSPKESAMGGETAKPIATPVAESKANES
ncbi:MAG: Ribonuclease E (EC [uncultured Thiotrichaceae bacterium]|uniref:Ribonuclease E n=1 Tax=uncultured Thiotrichaceae bacterium TaxID=298394 RepID=A0A6S6SCN0_9GAMM|nr:MAG: Ribonuclease E (EC [uncultured Thiotrichaceae bacterium]